MTSLSLKFRETLNLFVASDTILLFIMEFLRYFQWNCELLLAGTGLTALYV